MHLCINSVRASWGWQNTDYLNRIAGTVNYLISYGQYLELDPNDDIGTNKISPRPYYNQ